MLAVVADKVKSAAFVPDNAILLMLRTSVPPLDKVRVRVLLCPVVTLLKLRDEGTEIMG